MLGRESSDATGLRSDSCDEGLEGWLGEALGLTMRLLDSGAPMVALRCGAEGEVTTTQNLDMLSYG